jgi:lysophospholipase L1-like esterase
VSNNLRNTVEHPVDLGGGNWVRMSIAPGVDPSPAIDLDVFSTPNGNTDCWLFMGDSITYITMGYAFSNLPALVHQARPDRWPAVINAAIGGTNTTTAAAAIDETMSGFPGRYVVLAYGTNDQPNEFNMEPLVQKVIAAAKIPVVPHMPWAAGQNIQTNAPPNNKAIDDLYAKYPQIVHGPDLWAAFMNRTDLIPANDIHPNGAGQAFLRQQWAAVMAAIP